MRGAQPALPYGRMRIDCALEYDFLQIGRKHAQHRKNIGVGRRGRHEKLQRTRTGNFRSLRQWRRQKGNAIAHRIEMYRRFLLGRLVGQRAVGEIEIEARPLSTLERPLVFGALDEAIDVTHLQLHWWPLIPTVLLAVQEVIKEAKLQVPAVVSVEMGPVLDAVHF